VHTGRFDIPFQGRNDHPTGWGWNSPNKKMVGLIITLNCKSPTNVLPEIKQIPALFRKAPAIRKWFA
jgi:hypothetical protein